MKNKQEKKRITLSVSKMPFGIKCWQKAEKEEKASKR